MYTSQTSPLTTLIPHHHFFSPMAVGMTDKDIQTINRRMTSLSRHLVPAEFHNGSVNVALSNCSSGMDDTYHRVHGEVPTYIPRWKQALDDPANPFTDIIYEKAECIAKVILLILHCSFFCFLFYQAV